MIPVIWPSSTTSELERLVGEILSKNPRLDGRFRFASAPADVYGDQAIAVLPHSDPAAPSLLTETARECRRAGCRLCALFLGSSDMGFDDALLQLSFGDSPVSSLQVSALAESAESLAMLLGALIENFSAVAPEDFLSRSPGVPLIAAVAAVAYDTNRSRNLCYHRAFLDALNDVNVAKPDVDAAKVSAKAAEVLAMVSGIYPQFCQTDILHKFRAGKVDLEEFVPKASAAVNARFKALRDHLSAMLTATELSLPEKEAVLALVAGSESSRVAFSSAQRLTPREAEEIISTTDAEEMARQLSALEAERANLHTRLAKEVEEFKQHHRGLRRLCPPRYALKLHRLAIDADRRLQEADAAINRARHELDEMRLALHTAQIWIDNTEKLHSELADLHERLRRFNATLMSWRTDAMADLERFNRGSESVALTLSNDELLHDFYAAHRTELVGNITLWDTFMNIAFGKETVDEARARLESVTHRAVNALFDNFSLAEYLMGQEYPYLSAPDIAVTFKSLLNHIPDTAPGSATHFAIFAGMDPRRLRAWSTACAPYLPSQPEISDGGDVDKILLTAVQLQPTNHIAEPYDID
ncbi:MAG: hypothetical protein NC301_09170 [Bacteroides sp.]|nr:hypothetical protein [Bacteroides sp.]MCM1380247.1 hypothetical protein [Bacteroides sp.]MCM1446551.1 hypothetical protein [Prevotella sp.]